MIDLAEKEFFDCLDRHIEAVVDLRTSASELREHKSKIAVQTRKSLEFAFRQTQSRRHQSSTSIPAVRIPLERDPDEG